MAWTTPASYATNEVLASSKLNTHVRDNLRYLKGLDGQVLVESGVKIQANAATLYMRDTGGGANSKSWQWVADNDAIALQPLDDAETGGGGLSIAFLRSGTTTTAINAGAPVRLQNGSAGAPALTFITATGEGMFLPTSGAIGFATGFTERMRLTGTQLLLTNSANTIVGDVNLGLTTNTGDILCLKTTRPAADNAVTCGANGARWSAVWAANGTIQTSSRDTKRLLGEVSPAAAMASLRGVPVYRYHYLRPDGEPDTDYTHTGPVAEEMPAGMLVAPGLVNGMDATGYLMAALQDADARLRALEAERSAA